MSQWIEGRVVARRDWTDSLHTLEVDAPALAFVAGQFARLGLPAPSGEKDPMLGRPYSFVNPPHAPRHEFYFNVVPGGPLSPRLAALGPGDAVWLGARANGFFCIPEVPQAEALWCLATGTGIGPFLSILRSADAWDKFGRIVLVHAVRHASALSNYGDTIAGIARERQGAFAFVPVVSREPHPGALAGRIPALIADGRLETRAGVPLTADNAHAMLCGNPAMVDDVQAALASRGMKRHRRKEPGHITLETYW
jgi:ferredoxin--NADP+ reductase